MKIKKITYSLSALAFLMSSLNATTVKNVVEHTLQSNQDIVSKSINNDAYKKYIDEQEGGYYPKLDLTAYLGRKNVDETASSTTTESDITTNGGNAQLDLEQMLYDGNLTSSSVEEAKARYASNKLKNSNDIENIVYDSISAYLNVLKFDERIKISQENIAIHEDYLAIANQTERINGEILDKVQSKAKIHAAKSNLFEEKNSQAAAKSSFIKNVGMSIDSNICRPIIDESKIPANLEVLQKMALENNFTILEQIENIKEQEATIAVEKSAFLPTLKFKLQGIYDKDYIDEDLRTNAYSGKLELKYNIFNGMVNKNRTQKEELFLKEAQAKLDVVTKSVLDELAVAYETYETSKKQIVELKQFIEENKQIISIYKDQFDAGTRNFIDVLNVEGDLYNSKATLINTEYNMITAYYKILKATSSLESTVLNSNDQVCGAVVTKAKSNAKAANDTSVSDLLAEDTSMKSGAVQVNTVSPSTVSNEYALLLASYKDQAYANKILNSVSSSLQNNVKAKIVSNSNGTQSVALYNIDGLQNALALKKQFAGQFPQAYYIKKK
ncbi:TolC family protein [Arcobacter sp. s6]|jgi:outer membrane protein, adhesin transport system|uniref:TolC family protein n=1 Tax=Arcobacter sp. s6 TaxID=3230363 RepID=UPI0034A06099